MGGSYVRLKTYRHWRMAMWVPTQDEAIVMFARFLTARRGTAASMVARTTANKLQDGDLEGQRIWDAVADSIEQGARWPRLESERAA
jgi:hypothetical protein